MNLWSDFLTNDKRIIHKWQHYFPAYERHFGRYVYRPVVFWEIGCGNGGSVQMWKRYFGPHAQIIGLDIKPRCKIFEEDQVAIRIGDQSDPVFLDSVLKEFGPPDIVLDDGSHVMQHVVATFKHLYHRLDKNGVYMVEDLNTAYAERFGGGLRREGTYIELCKNLIDELNGQSARLYTPFTTSTMSMHFYDGMVAIERGKRGLRRALKMPDPGAAARDESDAGMEEDEFNPTEP